MSATLTVDQITKDTITQISYRYWSPPDENQKLEPFEANLIEDIYTNELLNSRFAVRRIMLLEFSQYLENYLWKYFDPKKTTKAHLISIVVMINEKFRERIPAWECFKTKSEEFAQFFHNVMLLCVEKFDNHKLNHQEHTILLKFLDNCVNSLEHDLVRLQIQKVCSLPMWTSLCDNRREYELSKLAKLKKFWKAIEKSDAKLSESDRERVQFERTFLRSLIKRFLDVLKSDESEELESGEIHDKKASKLNYLECFLELIIDLEALLPTRRFFNTLLEDTNLIIECDLWIQETKKKINDDLVFTGRYYLFMQLLDRVKFYNKFEIDEQTGEARDEHSRLDIHYAHLKSLQKGVFKYFRDDLITFALTNIACIDKRDELIKHLDGLTRERLYALAEHLHLVPYNSNQDSTTNGTNGSGKYSLDERMLLEIIIKHMELAPSQLDELNSMPLYPTETIVWDENLVPIDFKQTSFHDTCLALPKLNLQFLTLQDYLMRNFHLFRLESAYELRQDIEDAIMRLKPYFSLDEMQVCFGAWSRMAQPITNFTLVEVGEARVGEEAPSVVRANVTLDLEFLRQDVRTEWESLRRYDIGFLVTLRPEFNTPQQKFDPNDSFMRQMGIIAVRGCEIEGMLNNEGKLVDEAALRSGSKEAKDSLKFATSERSFRVILDANQYKLDMDNLKSNKINEDVYATFNVFVRRRPKENNFKAILESIRDLMNINFVVPPWLHDLLLGYGSPASATYYNLKEPKPTSALDFRDTFISREHLLKSFPGYEIDMSKAEEPPYKLKFLDLQGGDSNEKRIVVESHKVPNRGPYPQNQPKRNQVRFTPTQVEAIKSGMQPGLTLVVGPPGTGKTDVAVQIISNLYHNFPQQKCLIVTHSNQALNQLFDKLVLLDIDERHLLRLGHGEEELETEKDFSRYGRVDYVLAQRLKLLDQVDKLEQSLCLESGVNTAAYSCETAAHFFVNVVQPRWDLYLSKLSKIDSQTEKEKSEAVETLFPFAKFFEDAPQPLFNKEGSYANNLEVAKGCYRYIKLIFKQLEEFRAFELIRGGADRAEYLLVKEAKVIAMTCTHAALKRRDLVLSNFTYDSIIMEEAAQILEIETFIPLLLQNPDHNKQSRLKRWIMIGDHNQLPPVIKNMTFQKYSNMEQSLFTRFVKLQVPTIDLDAQGRCRPTLCELFKWRYKALGDLQHVLDQTEFKNANAGFRFDYQIIDVQDFNGQGESEPQPFYFQNLAEAEYAVAIYMYMRLLGYPSEKISILTTYNGQKHLIRDVLRKRTSNSDWMGQPHKITTVDKYQGQQNDFIILSLVRSKNVGHLRDVRRLIVALSRARLGLYILGRVNLFKSCFELTPAFNILLARRTTQLQLVMNEPYPAKRAIGDQVDKDRIRVIKDMPEMCQFAFDFYQHGGLVQKMETE